MSRNPDPEEVFTQKLTGRQRVHLRSPASFVVMVARIQGDVSHEALKQAVHHMQQRHAMLGVRVVADENGDPWFTSDDVEEIPIAQAPRSSETHWQRVCMDEFRIPFEIDRRPLIRFILLHSPDESDVVMLCQHSICDGLSLAYLTHDILEYLGIRAGGRDPPSAPRSRREHSLEISAEPTDRTAWEGDLLPLQQETGREQVSRSTTKMPRTSILRSGITTASSAHLRDRGNGTLHAGSSLSRQSRHSQRDPDHRFSRGSVRKSTGCERRVLREADCRDQSTRDLSPSAEGSFGLFASGADCELRYDPQESLWENSARFQPLIQRETDRKKSYRKSPYSATCNRDSSKLCPSPLTASTSHQKRQVRQAFTIQRSSRRPRAKVLPKARPSFPWVC